MPSQQYRTRTASNQQAQATQNRSVGTSNEGMRNRLQRHTSGSNLAKNMADNAFESTGLRPRVFGKALDAFEIAFTEGRSTSSIVTVIDYEMHSSEKRLWVIDLEEKKLLFHEFTTHGKGSDRNHDGKMDSASNTSDTNKSNVGLLKTGETYYGLHGESMRLDGLEEGFNDNARRRGIVVHSASYADNSFIETHGKAGRSKGCPALDPDVTGEIISTIKGGKLVFAYYPDPDWLEKSKYLNP